MNIELTFLKKAARGERSRIHADILAEIAQPTQPINC